MKESDDMGERVGEECADEVPCPACGELDEMRAWATGEPMCRDCLYDQHAEEPTP